MNPIEKLEKQLRKARVNERKNILLNVYKQLSTSHKGKKSNGEFRNFVETDSYNGHDLVWYVIEQLENHRLKYHANRLKEQYSGISTPPERDWTELPNIFGDKDTIEELVRSGDEGMHLAAFGAVVQAFKNVKQAEKVPCGPQILYPTSRQFPFDETTYKIIHELELREWNVPGIKVEFYGYGPSNAYKRVESIEDDDFRLWFCRVQGRLDGNWNDTAAVTQLNIHMKELHVYEDNSGPTLCLYVGKNWEQDKQSFVHGLKVNSKLRGELRTYLRYSGSWQKSHGGVYYPGRIAPFIAHDNDLEREYDPKLGEPKYFETQKVFKEFTEFLEDKLEQIKKH